MVLLDMISSDKKFTELGRLLILGKLVNTDELVALEFTNTILSLLSEDI